MKLQTALEYLMTYGWVFLIVAVVVGALYALGLFNQGNFVASSCAVPSAFQCISYTMNSAGALFLTLAQDTSTPINVTSLACYQSTSYVVFNAPVYPPVNVVYMTVGSQHNFTVQCYNSTGAKYSGPVGGIFTGYVAINYTTVSYIRGADTKQTATGTIVAKPSALAAFPTTASTTSTSTTSSTSTSTSTSTTSIYGQLPQPYSTVATYTGFTDPFALAVSANGLFLYIGEGNGAWSIVKYNTATDSVVSSTSTGYSDGCGGMSISTNGTFLYLPTYTNDNIGRWYTSNLVSAGAVGPTGTFYATCSAAASADGKTIYVYSQGSSGYGDVFAYNISTGSVTNTYGAYWGGWMYDAISPDGKYAYYSDTGAEAIYQITTGTGTKTSYGISAYPYGMAVSNNGNFIYFSGGGGEAYNWTSGSLTSLGIGAWNDPGQVVINAVGNIIYVAEWQSGGSGTGDVYEVT